MALVLLSRLGEPRVAFPPVATATQLALPAFFLSPPQYLPEFQITGGSAKPLSARMRNGWVVTGRETVKHKGMQSSLRIKGITRYDCWHVHLPHKGRRHIKALSHEITAERL